jgi:hypothetical protein
MVEVIDEGPFDLVIKKYPHQAKSSRQHGMSFFDDFALPPMRIMEMPYKVADPEIKPRCHCYSIALRHQQGNEKRPCSCKVELLSW